MNIQILLVASAFALISYCAHAQDDRLPDHYVAGLGIDQSVLLAARASDNPIKYLREVAETQVVRNIPEGHSEKASALRLLGRIGGTNEFAAVVKEIDFVDVTTGTYPAAHALVDMGKDIAPVLFAHVLQLDPRKNYYAVSAAAWVLQQLLGWDEYEQLLNTNRHRMSDILYEVLYSRNI